MRTHYLEGERFGVQSLNNEFRTRNYDICQAIDLIKLGIVLDKMILDGTPKAIAEIFRAQGSALNAAIRSENMRNASDREKGIGPPTPCKHNVIGWCWDCTYPKEEPRHDR